MRALKDKYRRRFSPLLLLLLLVLGAGCGDAPPDAPEAVLNTGSLRISSVVQVSATESFEPWQSGIILDGVDLGFVDNPVRLDDLLSGQHLISTYYTLDGRVLDGPRVNAEVAFRAVTDVKVVVNVGSISIRSYIDLPDESQIEPDSVGVILDADSIGCFRNPLTLSLIPEGDHEVSTYARYDDRDYVGSAIDVSVGLGETSAVNFRMLAGGAIFVFAEYNDQYVPEFGIKFDGENSDIAPSPRIISNVSSGEHRLVAWALDDTLRLEGWKIGLSVAIGETLNVHIDLQVVSPYEGFHAPDIDCEDIDGNSYALAENWGRIIWVYYFSYT